MKNFVLLGLVAVQFLVVDTTSADWQYTKWGMTPDEVKVAAEGKAVPAMDDQLPKSVVRTKLAAPYVAGRYQFRATFAFDKKSDRLAGVHLSLLNEEMGQQLMWDLSGKYGAPVAEDKTEFTNIKRWNTMTDVIVFMNIAGGFSVSYRPRVAEGAEGL